MHANYGADLARIHHEHFGSVARAAARELLSRLSRAGLRSGTVLDLAAGSGILSRAAADAGFDALGVDVSEDMLSIARAECDKARFVRASLWSFPLEPCVAVAAIGEAMSYATDAEGGPQAFERLLGSIFRALAPGGLLLFDVAGPGRSGSTGCRRGFWTVGDASIGLVEREHERTLRRAIHLFVPEGDAHRCVREEHVLHLYAPELVESALRQVGFAWERLPGYDGVELAPGWNAFAAVKPSGLSAAR